VSFTNTTNGTGNTTRSVSLTVNVNSPVADFTGSPTSGPAPLQVTFNDASTGGAITNWFWDFGDGGTTNATTNSVVHTYAAGTYPVTLVVTGPDGVSTNTKSNYITALTAFQSWQIRYFGSTTNPAAAATLDTDGDGCNNLCEFLSGTDPTNSASYFHITSVLATGSDAVITWVTAWGRTNVVQTNGGSPDGSFTTNFTDLSPLIILPPGSGETVTNYTDPGGVTNTPFRYYRVRLAP
jgi:PKD repeat protein